MHLEHRADDRNDATQNAVIFAQRKEELMKITLELVFLQQNHFGGLRNLNSDALQAFGLAHQLQDLPIEVYKEATGLGVTHNQGRLQTSFGSID